MVAPGSELPGVVVGGGGSVVDVVVVDVVVVDVVVVDVVVVVGGATIGMVVACGACGVQTEFDSAGANVLNRICAGVTEREPLSAAVAANSTVGTGTVPHAGIAPATGPVFTLTVEGPVEPETAKSTVRSATASGGKSMGPFPRPGVRSKENSASAPAVTSEGPVSSTDVSDGWVVIFVTWSKPRKMSQL